MNNFYCKKIGSKKIIIIKNLKKLKNRTIEKSKIL